MKDFVMRGALDSLDLGLQSIRVRVRVRISVRVRVREGQDRRQL